MADSKENYYLDLGSERIKENQDILLTQIVPTLLQMLGLEALGAEEKERKFHR